MVEYMIYGAKDNGNPNTEIFFVTDDLKVLKRVYKKLQRLNDLQTPQSKSLKAEHEDLILDLDQNEGVTIFSEDDYFDDELINWDINGVTEFTPLNTKLLDLVGGIKND